jgi:hypothetical protein
MLGTGHVLRVPVTQDGQGETLTVVVDQVVPRRGGAQCHVSGGHGGLWIPESLLQWAIARSEIAIDPGLPATPSR